MNPFCNNNEKPEAFPSPDVKGRNKKPHAFVDMIFEHLVPCRYVCIMSRRRWVTWEAIAQQWQPLPKTPHQREQQLAKRNENNKSHGA